MTNIINMDQQQMQEIIADIISKLDQLPIEVQEQFLLFLNNEFQAAKQLESNNPEMNAQLADQIAQEF
jgi:phospholipid N-methyltransferase